MPLTKILLAADGSEDAALASKAAADVAAKTGAELHVVHAWHLPGAEELAQMAEMLARTTGTPAEIHLEQGDGATAILNACEEDPATIAAVGTRGRGLVRRALLGGVSTKVLRATRGPVLVHATPPGAAASGSAGVVDSAARA